MKSLFLSGPMSGHLDYNRPAFHAEAARLRALGYRVENPAENPAPACDSWAGWMRYSIAQMMTCDAVAQLPRWIESRGARLEATLATELGIECLAAELIQYPYNTPEEAL